MTDTLPERLRVAHGNSFARRLFLEAADALDAMDKKCFALAANQCHDGYIGEHGDHQCRKVDRTSQRAKKWATKAKAAEAECKRQDNLLSGRSWSFNQVELARAAKKSRDRAIKSKKAAEAECERLRGAAREFNNTVMAAVAKHLPGTHTLAEAIITANKAWLYAGTVAVGHENRKADIV